MWCVYCNCGRGLCVVYVYMCMSQRERQRECHVVYVGSGENRRPICHETVGRKHTDSLKDQCVSLVTLSFLSVLFRRPTMLLAWTVKCSMLCCAVLFYPAIACF